MAEKTPIGTSQVNDFLRKRRQVSPNSQQSASPRRTIQRISADDAPPARGLIRKVSSSDTERKQPERPVGQLKRRVPTKQGVVSQAARPPKTGEDDKDRVKIVTRTLPDGRVVKKRLVKKIVKKKEELTPEEEEKLRLEKEQLEIEEAEKKAEEERLRKEKEAEEERLRLEKEAEEKRKEEERIRLEKEAEQKRIEEENVRQEKERQRIYNKIAFCKGALNDKDKKKAQKIAEEMVKRNIKWDGYISLTSGIGGAILR
ncbi:hypothetical protein KJ966_15405 [bacterium]|nr:hypothetical protein [bacterium]